MSSVVNKKSIEWFNLPAQLYKYANCLSEYIKHKEYNNEDDFMTLQMLYFKLMDIYKYFEENKVLYNFIPEEELLAVFKRKLIRYRMHFLDLYNEFSSMLDQIVMYKKKKKILSTINLSLIRESQTQSENSLIHLQESPITKKELDVSQSIKQKSIKTILLMMTSQFKENIKKIKPIYEEIVKLTPSLTQNLQNAMQKVSLSKQNSQQNENNNPKSSFTSQQSPSFNSSNFSLASSKSQESIESIMKTLLSLAQSIKQQIREIESQTQNLNEFEEHQSKFKNNKVAFFNCIGAIEIYWILRFDNISDFLKTQIKQLHKGMDMFLSKLKKNAQKTDSASSILITGSQKKNSQEGFKLFLQNDTSRHLSGNASNFQDNLSDGCSSQSSHELYYTAKSNQIPRYKISEQIALEEIPEEDQGKTSFTNDNNNNFFYYQSQQSELESKDDIDNQNNTLIQSYNNNEKFSLNSNFQFILKQGESQDNVFKSILSNSDINNKDSQAKINQNETEYRIEQTISLNITSRGDQKEQSKGNSQNTQDRKQSFQKILNDQAGSQKTSSTKSQANPSNPSGMSELMNQNQTWINDKSRISKKQPEEKLISMRYCLCISKIS